MTDRPRIIHAEDAPRAIGPYSQAVVANGFVFCSGQIALDPQTMQVVAGDVTAQTRRVMNNLAAVLTAAGTTFQYAVKATIYLQDMADFAAVNAVYAEYFPEAPPARATVAVARLPRDVLVEIDLVAAV